MKRIFPIERIISGLLLTLFSLAFFIYLFPDGLSFDKWMLFLLMPFIAALLFSIQLVTAHTAYNEEEVISWSFFHRRSIQIRKIIQVHRAWNNKTKSAKVSWYACCRDTETNSDFKIILYLPENYECKSVVMFMKTLKEANSNIAFIMNFNGEF